METSAQHHLNLPFRAQFYLHLSSFYLIYSKQKYVQSQCHRSILNPPRWTQKILHRCLLHYRSCSICTGALWSGHRELQSRYLSRDADTTNAIYFSSFGGNDGNISYGDYQGFKATLLYTFIITLCLATIWVVFVQFFPSKTPTATYLIAILLTLTVGIGAIFVKDT